MIFSADSNFTCAVESSPYGPSSCCWTEVGVYEPTNVRTNTICYFRETPRGSSSVIQTSLPACQTAGVEFLRFLVARIRHQPPLV